MPFNCVDHIATNQIPIMSIFECCGYNGQWQHKVDKINLMGMVQVYDTTFKQVASSNTQPNGIRLLNITKIIW